MAKKKNSKKGVASRPPVREAAVVAEAPEPIPAPAPPEVQPPRKRRPIEREPFRAPNGGERFEEIIPRAVWILMLLAALLRFPFLKLYGLWLDEIYVRDIVVGALSRSFSTVHFVHFLAIRPFTSLWDSDIMLRMPSFLFGILSVPLGFLVGRRFFDRQVGLLFSFFIAMGTYFINYSIDANYYSHMMFWVLASLYFYARLFSTKHFANLFPLLLIPIVCFFVHPFSALFFVSLGVVLFADMVLTPEYFERIPYFNSIFRTRLHRLLLLPVLLIVIAVIFLLIAGKGVFGQQVLAVTNKFIEMLSLGKSPSNIKFSYEFFENFFRRIGPGFFKDDALARSGTFVLFALFIFGSIWCFRRDRAFPFLFLFPFVLSFGLIFNLNAQRFFEIRYISYLVPLFWLAVSYAIVSLARGIGYVAGRFRPGVQWSPHIANAIAGCLIFFSLPQYAYMVTVDGGNWNKVMPVVTPKVKPDEPFVITNWAEEAIVPFYLRREGLKNPIKKLSYIESRDKFVESELQNLCYHTPNLWFVSTWVEIYSKFALKWAKTRLESVVTAPSAFGPINNVTLFHWDMGGRYVLPPRVLDYRPPPDKAAATSVFSEQFIVEDPMAYDFQLYFEGNARSARIEAAIDGKPRKFHTVGVSDAMTSLTTGIKLEGGRHELSITSASSQFKVNRIGIVPRYPEDRIIIPGYAAIDIHPSTYTVTPKIQDSYVMRFKRKTFATYEFGVPEKGVYRIECEAGHNMNEPVKSVLFEICVDGRSAGVIEFVNGPDHWAKRGFPVPLEAGNHEITATFLNERDLARVTPDPSMDRDALIRQFDIRKITADDKSRDDRIVVAAAQPIPIRLMDAADQIPEGWEFLALEDQHEKVTRSANGPPVFEATIPSFSEGLLLKSPVQPMPTSLINYYSAMLKCENLRNHSLNLRTLYLDEKGQEIKELIVNQEGINGNTEWIRFIEFRKVPSNVKSFRVLLWVYPNNHRPSTTPGKVYFSQPQIETYQ